MKSDKKLIDDKILKFYEKLSPQKLYMKFVISRDNLGLDWDALETYLYSKLGQQLTIKDLNASLNEYDKALRFYEILKPAFQEILWEYQESRECLLKVVQTFLGCEFSLKDLDTIEQLLLVTSLLEHKLGNIYFTYACGKSVPHLLKDLLQIEELSKVFGDFPIFFVRLIIGCPQSVNLRNIIWHGFPDYNEIPEHYVAILAFVVVYFDEKVKHLGLEVQMRKKILKFDTLTFEPGPIAPKSIKIHPQFWRRAVKHYQDGNFAMSVILMLPQIELILRLAYEKANKFDISAKLDEYYITIDTIMEKDIPGRQIAEVNQITNELPNGCMDLIYDGFIAPNGLRLRDKVGHGEACLRAVTREMCEYLYCFATCVLENKAIDYQSRYHIQAKVYSLLGKQFKHLDVLKQGIPRQATTHTSIDFFEHRNEAITKLLQILENMDIYGLNLVVLIDGLQTKTSLTVRSRKRKTMEQISKSLPQLIDFYKNNVHIADRLYRGLITEKNLDKLELQKYLKYFLKTMENLKIYTNQNSNEWIKSLEIIQKSEYIYNEFHDKFGIN